MAMIGRLSNTSYMGFQYNVDNVVDHLITTGITSIPGKRRSVEELEGISWNLNPSEQNLAQQNSQPFYKPDYQFGYTQGKGKTFSGGYGEYHNSQWTLPPAWTESGVMLVLPAAPGLWSEVISRWESITINRLNNQTWSDNKAKLAFVGNLLGEKRHLILLEDRYRGSTYKQDRAYRDLDRITCEETKNLWSFLEDLSQLAIKSGRLYFPSTTEKLFAMLSPSLFKKIFDDSSVYSISEGEGDTHQSISIMVQDTPVEEAAFMIIKESDENDGEQEEEEEEDDQFNHNSFMFHPGPPTKIAEMRIEEPIRAIQASNSPFVPVLWRWKLMDQVVVSEQDELPSSIRLEFQARLDGDQIQDILRQSDCLDRLREIPWLTTGRLVNGSLCDGIDMVIKNLDLEPKVYAMVRDFLEKIAAKVSRFNRDAVVKENILDNLHIETVTPSPTTENIILRNVGVVAQDIELSAAKEAVKAMRSLQAIIQCKAQICFGKSTKDNYWDVPVAILEALVLQRYLRLSDGSVLACYVCTPPVFMRKEELMVPHKEEKGESHKKVFSEDHEELRLRLAYKEAVSILACCFPDAHRPFLEGEDWCTSDCGWITGHNYVTYGPLLNEARVVLYEGVLDYPDAGRWDIVDKYKVTIFYTAPTLVRSLMHDGDEIDDLKNFLNVFVRIFMIRTAEGVENKLKSGDLNSSRLSVLKCLLDDRNSHSGSLKEEPKFEAADTEMHRDQRNESGHIDDQPDNEAAPQHDWFQKPDKPPTPDPVNDRLDWHNPEGCEYPFNLSKPLPLIKDQRRQVVHADYFINNDLEYLKGGSSSSKYVTSTTRTKAANQNRRDLPRDITLDSVVLLRYEKRSKGKNKGKVPTKMELELEQTQKGSSYEVSISAKGVKELKIKVKIKGEKKKALLTLRQKPGQYICCQESQR
uniref:acetate--CoA ligase n=2 Tax=Tanacetum cinerariifolium TaxID=118510 RepID=A0A6L2N512_TANCI|nr:acetyl-coenzyme A synthetase, chloroplastic/glyoxysomal isoform X2 [Tanacetum cinerariifolium]